MNKLIKSKNKIGLSLIQLNRWSRTMFIFVKEVKYLKDYKIELKFNDGKKGVADLESELYGTMFEPVKDKSIFSKVRVDEDLETITWENGADLAPEFLYYKSFQKEVSLEKQFKQWGYMIE